MTDLAQPPQLQDHRFGELLKGKHYSYARGLTINPTHLPAALDAMLEHVLAPVLEKSKDSGDKISIPLGRRGPVPG